MERIIYLFSYLFFYLQRCYISRPKFEVSVARWNFKIVPRKDYRSPCKGRGSKGVMGRDPGRDGEGDTQKERQWKNEPLKWGTVRQKEGVKEYEGQDIGPVSEVPNALLSCQQNSRLVTSRQRKCMRAMNTPWYCYYDRPKVKLTEILSNMRLVC